ncbi:MAG: hypothetical protein JWO95_2135 [Verrucomicrobiales bacterium]|nr:hypothetical protein [Verrucomicrobiales bacterium]
MNAGSRKWTRRWQNTYAREKMVQDVGGKGIIRKSMRIARVGAIKDYKPFDRAKIPQRNAYAPTQPNRVVYVPAAVHP